MNMLGSGQKTDWAEPSLCSLWEMGGYKWKQSEFWRKKVRPADGKET